MASIDKRPNGTWRARWREYPGGPQRTKSFARKVDAERHLVSVQHDLMRGTYVDRATGWATWAASYAARQPWRASSRARIVQALDAATKRWGERPLTSIRRGDVEALLSSLGLSPASIGFARSAISSAFRAAVDDGLVARNPVDGVKVARSASSITVPTTADVRDVLERSTPSMRPAVVLGALAGLRHAEASGLTVDRCDFLRRAIRVDRQWVTPVNGGAAAFGPPKTPASTRTVPVAVEVIELLARSVEEHGLGDDGRIVHERGKPLDRSTFGRRWTALGVSFRFHDLRHHHASLLIAAGCSVTAVQHALGHDNATTTLNTYSHLWPSDDDRLRAAVSSSWGLAEDSTPTPSAIAAGQSPFPGSAG